MPTIRDVLREKNTQVLSTHPQTSVLDAIHQMNQHKVGALVVLQDGRIVGMFTERDVLRRVVGAERPPAEMMVADVMTSDVVCCPASTDLDDVSHIMAERRIRHIPVCDDDGGLLGLISIGDVNATHANDQAQHLHYLSEYIYGRV